MVYYVWRRSWWPELGNKIFLNDVDVPWKKGGNVGGDKLNVIIRKYLCPLTFSHYPRTTNPMVAMMMSVRSLTRVTKVLRWEVTCVEEEWRNEMKMRITEAISWTDTSGTERTVFRGAEGLNHHSLLLY